MGSIMKWQNDVSNVNAVLGKRMTEMKEMEMNFSLQTPGQGLLSVCVYNERCCVHFKGE